MAKKQSAEKVKAARAERAAATSEEAHEASAPARNARETRDQHLKDQIQASRQREIDRFAEEEEKAREEEPEVTLLTGKPGSGAGLKPGDFFAPESNPGAAARVPNQPLQPESLQSHGLGIVYDKDLANPPYDTGDPLVTDRGPSGLMDEDATDEEAEKAQKATPRSKQMDPDNPARGGNGLKDATASPNRKGSAHASKSNVSGGSNSGS